MQSDHSPQRLEEKNSFFFVLVFVLETWKLCVNIMNFSFSQNYSLNIGPIRIKRVKGRVNENLEKDCCWCESFILAYFPWSEAVFDWNVHSHRKLINLSVFWSVAAYTDRQSDISNHAFVSPTIIPVFKYYTRHAKTTRLYMFKQQCYYYYYYYYEHVCVWCLRLLFVSQMWLSIHCSCLKNSFHFAVHILRCCLLWSSSFSSSSAQFLIRFNFAFEVFRRSCVCFYVGMH